jgi:hypothetical protein
MSLLGSTGARIVAGVVLIGFALTGCSDSPVAPEYLPPGQCPPLTAGPTVSPAPPGALPGDFAAVEVRRCTYTMLLAPQSPAAPSPAAADRGWVWQSVQRSAGPLDDLVRALRLPPPERDDSGDTVCPAVATAPVTLALVDAAGRAVLPAVPATACGQPLPEVTAALEALSWTTRAP